MASKKNTFTVRGGTTTDESEYGAGVKFWDTVSTIAKAWKAANPQDKRSIKQIGEWIIQTNNLKDKDGRDCTGKSIDVAVIHKNQVLTLPPGNALGEFDVVYDCPPERKVTQKRVAAPPAPMMEAPPPPPPAPAPEREIGPTEYVRQSTPSQDGRRWAPGSEIQALELYARSGVNPQFTKKWYALHNVAARWPVTTAQDSGLNGLKVNGNIASDHLLEGKNLLGENGESRIDDEAKKRHAMTGRKGLVGEFFTGPRQRGFVSGHTDHIDADGSIIRAEKMPLEFAHGGNYAFTLFGVTVPTGNMLGLPVGALKTSPQDQVVLPAETRRWGIVQAVDAMATVNVQGYDNMFRDEQTRLSSPFETPDRINAMLHRDFAARTFIDSMRAVDTQTDPAAKAQAAERALTAWRDFSNNALTKRVDSLRIPLAEGRAGVERYLASQGLDAAAISARANAAPELEITDMQQGLLESLQDYKKLKKTRYAGIAPGQTNAAYVSTARDAYRTMNSFEADYAAGRAPVLSEEQMIASARTAVEAIVAKPEAVATLGDAMQRNSSIALQTGMLLADIKKNHQNYGMKADEADRFVGQFLDGDKSAAKQVSRRGDTTPVPVFGKDQPYAMAEPGVVGAVVGRKIQQFPELGAALLNIASDPKLGRDSKGKSDGRRYAIGILREYGAERLGHGIQEGTVPSSYQHLEAQIDPAAKKPLYDTVLAAVSYGEDGASGRSGRGVQRLDNLYAAAQAGKVGGERFNAGAFNSEKVVAAARNGDMGGVYDDLVRSGEARETGSDRNLALGLKAHPALARDTVLLTLLREPNAFNKVITDLRTLDKSNRGDRYGELAGALEKTRNAALKGDQTGAVQHFGAFFTNLAATDGKHVAAARKNAWEGLVSAIGNDAAATAWMLDTAANDPKLRDALLAAVPDALVATDGARHSSQINYSKGQRVAEGINGDHVYTSRFFTLPTDEKGKVKKSGIFGKSKVHVNASDIAAALAGNSLVTDASRALTLSGVTAGHALNTNPTILLGAANQNPEAALAAWMEKSGQQPPAGMTYAQLAAESIKAGYVTVTTSDKLLVATPISASVDGTITAAGGLSVAVGVSKWWVPYHKEEKKDIPVIGGVVPGCPPIPRPGDAPGTVCPATPITTGVVPGR